jgi:hypothetical protein
VQRINKAPDEEDIRITVDLFRKIQSHQIYPAARASTRSIWLSYCWRPDTAKPNIARTIIRKKTDG